MARINLQHFEDDGQQQSYGLITPGEYAMHVVAADVAPTNAGDGTKLEVQIQIDGPSFSGRRVFETFALDKGGVPNKTAHQNLGGMCRAMGMPADYNPDTEELIGHPFVASIMTKPAQGQYAEKSIIKAFSWKPSTSGVPQRPTAPVASSDPFPSPAPTAPLRTNGPAPAAFAPANGKAAPPWASKAAA